MAQLSLRERLQPALLDRLIDDERLLTVLRIPSRSRKRSFAVSDSASGICWAFSRHRGCAGDRGALIAQPLRTGSACSSSAPTAAAVSPVAAQVAGVEAARCTRRAVALQSFCEIAARNVVNNTTAEPASSRRRCAACASTFAGI